ncbi:MAG: hypothetical protein JNM96_04585 [Bacteroidia bacterium]|nr:hypothetical protein [Bacteroidia bacterium]
MNCSNHFNSGSSGYRHKINITSSNFDVIVDLILEHILENDVPEDTQKAENELLENFQLCDIQENFDGNFNLEIGPNSLFEKSNSISNQLLELASPPPKVA